MTPPYPRKRFGQHFLRDTITVARIIDAIAPQPGDHLVEIGPGLGALTTHLLPLIGNMDAIELDRDLIPKLSARCKPLGNLRIHQADALTFDFSTLYTGEKSLRVIGNLPYNISTPLLFHLIDHIDIIKDMYFMLQKEVVDRLAAPHSCKDYGRLSVMMQYHCEIESLLNVSPDAFNPPPKVQSAVVRLIPHATRPATAEDPKNLEKIVRQAFGQRRKTIRNTLKDIITDDQWSLLDIDPTLRPENLTVMDYVRLSNFTKPDPSTHGEVGNE